MPTKTISVLTDAQKRTVEEIYRSFGGWTGEQLDAATGISNASHDRLNPVRARVEAQCSRGRNDRVIELSEQHDLSDDEEVQLSDEAYEYQIKGGCGPLVGDAILAVVAQPWISRADYKALTEGWVKLCGPIPA